MVMLKLHGVCRLLALMARVIGHPWVSAGFSDNDAQHWGFG